MATLGIGLSKVFILDKYFNELSKYWETEIKLQGTYKWNQFHFFLRCDRLQPRSRGSTRFFGETKDVRQVTEMVWFNEDTFMWSDNRMKYDGAIGLWWFFKNSISLLTFFHPIKTGKKSFLLFFCRLNKEYAFFLNKMVFVLFRTSVSVRITLTVEKQKKKQLNIDGEWHRIEDKRTNKKKQESLMCRRWEDRLATWYGFCFAQHTHTQCCSHLISVQK